MARARSREEPPAAGSTPSLPVDSTPQHRRTKDPQVGRSRTTIPLPIKDNPYTTIRSHPPKRDMTKDTNQDHITKRSSDIAQFFPQGAEAGSVDEKLSLRGVVALLESMAQIPGGNVGKLLVA